MKIINKIHVLRVEGSNVSDDTSTEFFEKCELEAQELLDRKKDEIDSFMREFLK